MIKTLIIEDEKEVGNLIKTLLSNYTSNLDIIGIIGSVKKSISIIKEEKPSIVFLDVELEDGNGFDVLNHFKDREFVVVFITGYSKYSINAIKYQACDYILKPVLLKDLKAAVEKAKRKVFEKNILKEVSKTNKNLLSERFVIPASDKNSIIYNYDDIIYIASEEGYSNFYMKNKATLLIKKTLKHYEEVLPNHFLRVHKSYIVNLKFVQSYRIKRSGLLFLKDEKSIPISARKKQLFLRNLKAISHS